ncbi:hypothetical protein R1flu_006420 [Riccia fluitans]|uniref:Uncharacterized protein n=1 Tax=Riccia fluitans TaxID=41844 RepID=A0ABD1YWL8_9MARC
MFRNKLRIGVSANDWRFGLTNVVRENGGHVCTSISCVNCCWIPVWMGFALLHRFSIGTVQLQFFDSLNSAGP